MRIILKYILQLLSIWAVAKHEIELVIVIGWLGVELTKEGVYSVLKEKFIVRRNTKPIWWDLSIPLNILGYEDKERKILDWIRLIIKSICILILKRKSKYTLILSVHSGVQSTAIYWGKIIKPNYLIIVNHSKKSSVTDHLIKATIKYGGLIIYDKDDFKSKKFSRGFMYGTTKSAHVSYTENKQAIIIKYKKHKVRFPKYYIPSYTKKFIAAIVAFSIARGVDIDDILSGLLKFDLRERILEKISKKISEKES